MSKAWNPDRLRNVLDRLKVFERLERKATDETGWIALAFGISRKEAAAAIKLARKLP